MNRITQGILITFDNEMPPMMYHKRVLSKDMFTDRTELFNQVADDIIKDFVSSGIAVYLPAHIGKVYHIEGNTTRYEETYFKDPAWLMNVTFITVGRGEDHHRHSRFNQVFRSKLKGYFFKRGGNTSFYTAYQLQCRYRHLKSNAIDRHFKSAPILNACNHIELDDYSMREYERMLEDKEEERQDNMIMGGYVKLKDVLWCGTYEMDVSRKEALMICSQ